MKQHLTKVFSKTWVLWALIAVLLAGMFFLVKSINTPQVTAVSYSTLVAKLKAGEVTNIVIEGNTAIAGLRTDKGLVSVSATIPTASPLLTEAQQAGVVIQARSEEASLGMTVLMSFGPTLLVIAAWLYFMRRSQPGMPKGAGQANMSDSRAAVSKKDEIPVRFSDVAGCDEAKEEVREIVDFLANPGRYEKVGGYIPRGVLLQGPPGTGKTLLARAIAGEAGVPFLSISGSDFMEMFVGVGASRVRSLFEKAKKMAPCIIFIDEIDAVGRQRGSGSGGGHDEREQTLNQLLVEMNGFKPNSGVIVVAATNRPEILDNALTRPGRFDRQVHVGLPDVRGRTQILKVHLRKVPVAADVNLESLAKGTTGFAGADLQNLVNVAALHAAAANQPLVHMADFEHALDHVTMGAERKSVRMPEHERRNTGYHESGHAVVAKLLPTADPVHKVSIMPRGRALGVTLQRPTEDRYSLSRSKILDNIAILFAGRLAEEIFTGEITTGASNDYERATALARNMVTRWGMSDTFGQMVVGDMGLDPFGSARQAGGTLAEATLQKADAEVSRILQEQYDRARNLLLENREIVENMTKALLEWETIDEVQINDLMAGREPRAPKDDSPVQQDAPTAPASTPENPVVSPNLTPALASVSE